MPEDKNRLALKLVPELYKIKQIMLNILNIYIEEINEEMKKMPSVAELIETDEGLTVLQNVIQAESRRYQTISNAMMASHQASMAAINNMK